MGIGSQGENLACIFLKNRGYKILATNFHSRFGEIDIIAKEKDTIVFVEVKSRSNNLFGAPLESITKLKLSKIVKTSEFFLKEKGLENNAFRFDAIEVLFGKKDPKISHIKNITS